MKRAIVQDNKTRKSKERWREEVASRVISISGSLLQEGRGVVVHEFQKDLDALLVKHGITRYPYLNVTVAQKNGRFTPIAAPDGYPRQGVDNE
jgi:hypothetical protein